MSGRRRRSVEVRRDEILTTTVGLFDRIGLNNTRVADVAHELGISASLVFYHFGTKDRLVADAFAHAVAHDLARLDKAMSGETDAVDRLRRVLRLYGPEGDASGWRLWMDSWTLAQREPTIRTVLRKMDRRWTGALREVMAAGVEQGVFDCDDPAASAIRVSALLDGLSVSTLVYGTTTRKQLRSWAASAVAVELGIDAEQLL